MIVVFCNDSYRYEDVTMYAEDVRHLPRAGDYVQVGKMLCSSRVRRVVHDYQDNQILIYVEAP